MTKLRAFIHLDFITVKPYFTLKNLLLYVAVTVFLTVMSGNIASGMGAGITLGTMFVNYPFYLGEKSSLDTLYATLSVNRKTVVSGRYLSTFALNLCAVLITFIFATVGLFVSNAVGANFRGQTIETVWVTIAFAVILIIVQSIQLSVYFKLSYSNAMLFSLIPFVALLTGYLSIVNNSAFLNRAVEFLNRLNGFGVAALIVLALTLIIYISYSLSLSFYKKREF